MNDTLCSKNGINYPIRNGIPRILDKKELKTVDSFGDEWNYFNFVDFKNNWLKHTVKNTFGTTDVFKNKVIVDAGGGSGAQTKWFLEYGAKHVIFMDLSHSVDDVVQRNLKDIDPTKYDIVQCSIDKPPILNSSIDGMIYCHNVIQHTPSVENTAIALYKLLDNEGELVFNCYGVNDQGFLRWFRWNFVYKPLRFTLKRLPFDLRILYSRIFAFLRLIPLLGNILEKFYLVVQGDVPKVKNESFLKRLKTRYKNAFILTFDAYGSHKYQWHKTNDEIKFLINSLDPKPSKVLNTRDYFSKRPPIGCALRVFK